MCRRATRKLLSFEKGYLLSAKGGCKVVMVLKSADTFFTVLPALKKSAMLTAINCFDTIFVCYVLLASCFLRTKACHKHVLCAKHVLVNRFFLSNHFECLGFHGPEAYGATLNEKTHFEVSTFSN